jgi:type VI secretion system protein ImpA
MPGRRRRAAIDRTIRMTSFLGAQAPGRQPLQATRFKKVTDAMLQDIETLLLPVRNDAPAGDDLAFSNEFDAVQEARRADDPTLDQGDWVRELKEADWRAVVDKTAALLRSRSKDLRLAVWLAEALGMTEGFAGLAQGFDLVQRLLERYWDELYPHLDGGDLEERAGNLGWLVQRATQVVRQTPLTENGGAPYAWVDYESARALQPILDKTEDDEVDNVAAGRTTLAQFAGAAGRTPVAYFGHLVTGLGALRESMARLELTVDAHIGQAGPAFSPLREAVEQVGELVARLARDAGVGTPAAGEAVAENPEATAAPPAQANVSSSLNSRAQALAQLRAVAEYFRRTEPHSPVAYLAAKAASWGELPLHLWLRQVVKDEGALARLEELLGTEDTREG